MTQEVKTRRTFEEWYSEEIGPNKNLEYETAVLRRQGWNAALASVEFTTTLTRDDIEVIVKEYRGDPRIAMDVWNAIKFAISEVPNGKRFEVGEVVEVEDKDGTWNPCVVTIVGSNGKPAYGRVRPLPKTVELTVSEKRIAVMNEMIAVARFDTQTEALACIVDDLANGKTLDQLCSEYGIATTREVS